MSWLDGKKRYLLLAVFIVQALVQLAVPGRDIVDATRLILFNIPGSLAYGLVVLQVVLACYAVYEGWLKDREARERLTR